MANTKQYTIKINGLQESIDAVATLNKQLNLLEQRMNTINTAKTSTGGGSSRSGNSALSQEEAVQKEINKLKAEGQKLDAKIAASQDEIYKRVDATKQLYKETIADQKAIAAQERLTANAYSNTMVGMKQQLADIKAVIQTTDLSDNDGIKKLTEQANELTNKLKEMEEAYGQFGRNVGNYKSAFEGLEKISVTVGGVTQEFNNLKQAQKALRDGMGALEANGKKDTKMYKEMERELEKVSKAQLRLNSAIKDAKSSSKAMDDLLDIFESFGALQQITQGFSTLFGIDDSEVEKQIAKLVALQNALKGIEKIRQQMNTQEGFGKIFSKGSKAVDQFVAKIAGADYRMGKIIGTTKSASIALNTFSNVLKGVGAVALTGGFMVITNVIGDLVSKFMKWANAGFEVGDAAKMLNAQFDTMANTFERIKKENVDNYFYKMADETATLKNSLYSVNTELQTLLSYLGDVKEFGGVETTFGITGNIKKPLAGSLDEAKKNFREQLKLIEEYEKKVENSVVPLRGVLSNIFGETGRMKRNVKELGEAILQDFLYRVNEASSKAQQEIAKTGKISKDTADTIRELNKEANEDFAVNSVLNNVEKFSEKGEYYASQIGKVTEALKQLGTYSVIDPAKMEQYIIDGMADSEEKIRKQNELNRKKEIESVDFNPEYIDAINKKYDRELQENLKSYRKTKKQEADQKKKEERDVQNEIDEYKLQLMREGLAKEQRTLQLERKQRIKEIEDSGIRVGERRVLVEQVYNKKIKELNRDWAYEMENIYQDMYGKILDIQKNAQEKMQSSELSNLEMGTNSKRNNAWKGSINADNPNNLSSRNKYYQDLLDIELEASRKEEEIRKRNLKNELKYNQDEEKLRHERVADAKTVNLVMQELMKAPNPDEADYSEMEKNLQGALSEMRGELVDAYNQGKLDFKKFVELIKQEQVAFNDSMEALQAEYNTESNKIVQEGLDKKTSAYNTYYTNLLSSVRTMQDDVARQMQKTPIKDDTWGVVKVSRTKEQYSASIDAYNNIAAEIKRIQAKLKKDLQSGNIKEEDFFMKNNELEAMKKSAEDATREVLEKQKMLGAEFMQSIQQYIQAGMQAFNQILQALWDYQDNVFDDEQEEIDKMNDKLDKALDKQQEIVEEHKSNIDEIENELANARGSRRQHLIDQINAEIEAERAAAKEKKKIEKEQEAAQKKQDELDKKRKKAQYKRDMLQAIVNGAMAVTMAAVNAWPVPAIPMMALAAATTAAQIAIMASNKPYAKGGQLDGPSHAQGGIKVPGIGGGIELEGQEYVIRKKTTNKNIDLLDYINRSERKLSLDDFIDFYGGKVKKSVTSMSPGRKFADGGALPTINNNYEFDDRLLSAFEDYSNRPVQVSVVDINNRQEAVKNVQVLAGLEQ